ncbi:AHH domain-containing protein [Flavobacterium sp. CLA17]|uniref:AHH domain-containing protein n=1 Tax=Flavobacterium sp. CLA17 TaxID=2724135 RepID=UPI001491ABB3|nr:AHH domain-containing protein [Flavobacterium sp. CLA17]QSB28032.1 AHH domain-containing protein [Flavobacterium sp. CLA17]
MGKTKKIFIVKLLALAIFLILYGCSAEIDKSEIPNQEKENFIILHKNYDYFKSNTSLFNRLKNLDNLKSNVTSKNIQTEDFKIFTDNITYTKRPDKLRESYTFYIEKLNYASNKTIDNLILARNLGDEKFKAYIITYYFPDGIASQHNNFKITEFKEINSETFSIQNITSKKNCENTYEFNIIETAHKCYSGAHSGESQAGQCDGNGAPPYSTYQVVAYLTNSCGEGTTGGSTDGGPSGPGGGGGSGSGGGGGPAVDTGISLPPPCQSADCGVPILANEINDLLGSTLDYSQLEFLSHHDDVAASLKSFLGQNNTAADKSFVKQIIDVVKNDAAVDSKAFSFVLSAQADTKIETELDNNFFLSVDQFMDADLADINSKDPDLIIYFGQHHIEKMIRLKKINPQWSYLKCYWEASKEVVHITLDVFGTVPVVGELADVTNGVLYLIEGDGVNASLSAASAVPVAGWAAVSTKYAIKFRQATTIATKVKLVWKVTDNVITFGSRSQLRKVLGLVVGDLRQAHHIIPWAKQSKAAIQKASKSQHAFHLNEAINGIPLSTAIHSGSHAHYDNLIQGYLDNIPLNATPDEAYIKVMEIISKVRTAIQNNPGVPINQLNF